MVTYIDEIHKGFHQEVESDEDERDEHNEKKLTQKMRKMTFIHFFFQFK